MQIADQNKSGRASALASATMQQVSRLPLGRVGPYSGLLLWGLLILIFALIVPDTFLTVQTLRTVAADQAITAIMALAILAPLAAGVFDLSIASMMGLAIVLVAYLQARAGIPWGAAIVLTLLTGMAIGAANAFVIVKLRVDSFIGTLGSSSILLAAIQWVTGGQQIVSGIAEGFTNLAGTQLFTVPLPFYYMLALAAVFWYVLEFRQVGRYLYATGSNPEAARLAGVRTNRLRAGSLVLSATMASLAGIIFTAKIGSASPDSSASYLLPAFAGTFLGATQIKSGRFNVPGTLIAVYLLATGVKGLQLAGQPNWVSDIFNGGALILAVAMAGLVERRVSGERKRSADSGAPDETSPTTTAVAAETGPG